MKREAQKIIKVTKAHYGGSEMNPALLQLIKIMARQAVNDYLKSQQNNQQDKQAA